jgi:hypothetical protein
MQHGENAIVLCSELLSRLLALLRWALHIHWNKAARRGIRGRRELWKQFTAKVRTWLMGAQRLSDLVGRKGCVWTTRSIYYRYRKGSWRHRLVFLHNDTNWS